MMMMMTMTMTTITYHLFFHSQSHIPNGTNSCSERNVCSTARPNQAEGQLSLAFIFLIPSAQE